MTASQPRVGHADRLRRRRAGLVSGPSTLKTVGTPRSRRGTAAWRMPGVEHRREAEGDAGLLEARPDGGGRQVDHHAERLEQVGRAARRGGRAVAVLDDRHAGAGHDQRAMVERLTVLDGRPRCRRCRRRGPDRHGAASSSMTRPAGDLLGRLALGAQRDHEAGDLRGRGLARP
jgi:hypothetical protein